MTAKLLTAKLPALRLPNCQLKTVAAIPCFNTERWITDVVKLEFDSIHS